VHGKTFAVENQSIIMINTTHQLLHSHRIFIFFTWFTRILLAIAFVPSGWKKFIGIRFTALGLENPIGFFFEALYRTGFYWNFLGGMQLLIAILLLIPRTAYLGALIYFPMVLNIVVIVISMHFEGTPVVAALMLLANIYLLVWDYPKTRKIVGAIFCKS
jgi:uncharacterized membrane protein YphA (DoxX/SURF4 family)